jgi:hypothetical protein
VAVRFEDLAARVALPLVALEDWEGIVARRAPRFAKLAALIRRSQHDPASGADELHFEHDRTYDDSRLRAALGSAYRPAPPVDGAYLERFTAAMRERFFSSAR